MADRSVRRVGLIGFGAIGQAVARALVTGEVAHAVLAAVLVRDAGRYQATVNDVLGDAPVVFTDDPERFFAADFDLLVEAAGQEAVRQYGEQALRRGLDFLVVSIGAFTDDALYEHLTALAARGEGRLLLAAGALPAVDWMYAAAQAPVGRVTITQTKPVVSWLGTPAESLIDLADLSAPVCFFEGTARKAASTFPKSSNITAMLALATVGLDAVKVRLVADPFRDRMHTRIDFQGDAGTVSVVWEGVPSATNPSTSADVPLAVVKTIRNWAADVVVGV